MIAKFKAQTQITTLKILFGYDKCSHDKCSHDKCSHILEKCSQMWALFFWKIWSKNNFLTFLHNYWLNPARKQALYQEFYLWLPDEVKNRIWSFFHHQKYQFCVFIFLQFLTSKLCFFQTLFLHKTWHKILHLLASIHIPQRLLKKFYRPFFKNVSTYFHFVKGYPLTKWKSPYFWYNVSTSQMREHFSYLWALIIFGAFLLIGPVLNIFDRHLALTMCQTYI